MKRMNKTMTANASLPVAASRSITIRCRLLLAISCAAALMVLLAVSGALRGQEAHASGANATPYLFITNSNLHMSTVKMMNLTDGSMTTIVDSGFTFTTTPTVIEVDQEGGHIFYADTNQHISKIRLSDSATVGTIDAGNKVNYLALDRSSGKLYFTSTLIDTANWTQNSQLRVWNPGHTAETLYAPTGNYSNILGTAVDETGGNVYFFQSTGAEVHHNSFMRMSAATKAVASYKTGIGGNYTDMVIDSASRKLYYTVSNTVGAVDLNTGTEQTLYTSGNADNYIKHIDFDSASGKIYFALSNNQYDSSVTIYRMNADGSAVYPVHTGSNIKGFAVNEVPSFTLRPIADKTLNGVGEGYLPGTQEEKEVQLVRTGVGRLEQLSVTIGNSDHFVITQPPALTTLDDDASETSFKLKAKDDLPPGVYTTAVTVKADRMADVTFYVTQEVYSADIAEMADLTLNALTAGYAEGSSRTVTVARTGQGTLYNLNVALSGGDTDAFEIDPPAATTLDDATPSTTFALKSRTGLAPGVYRAIVSVTAEHKTPKTFEVTQTVHHSYTVAPIADATLDALTAGYSEGSSKTITVTRTGTGVLNNLSVSLSGGDSGAFALVPPTANRLDDATSSTSFTVQAGAGLETGSYTAIVTVRADQMADVSFAVRLTVHPSQDAALRELTVSAGELEPAFDADVYQYTVSVPHETASTEVTAVANDVKASYAVYADGAPAAGTIPLKVGVNRIEVQVTAEDNTTELTYVVEVTRAPSGNAALGSLSLDGIPLNEPVHADTYEYTAAVPNETALTRVNAVPADPAAVVSSITANGQPAAGDIALLVGSNVIEVEITAQDQTTTLVYAITVVREASDNTRLESLAVNPGSLDPAFAADTRTYAADVVHETAAITITAAAEHEAARLTINGEEVASGSGADVALTVGSNAIPVVVTAENGVDTATYTITVNRAASVNADLRSLALSAGSIEPEFDTDTLEYTATVPYGAARLSVTAETAHEGATLTIGGIAAASGSESGPVMLQTGENRIAIVVTAQDGVTTKSYEVTVTRQQAPPPPPVLPMPDESRDRLGVYLNDMLLERLAKSEVEASNGRATVVVTFDSDELVSRLKEAASPAVLVVPIDTEADETAVRLSSGVIQALEEKRGMFVLRTPDGHILLPAAEISAQRIAERLSLPALERSPEEWSGEDGRSEMNLRIAVAAGDPSKAERLERHAKEQGFAVVAPPFEFTVSAEHAGRSVRMDEFSRHVQMEIPLPNGRNRGTVTAVAVDEDGTLRHVPTRLIESGDAVMAAAYSLKSGTYAVIGRTVAFEDTAGHWGRAAIEELASRMVLNGAAPGRFQPDAAITRAEFAAILVRALGLPAGGAGELPKDVREADWHAPAVSAAQKYGIAGGYADGSFRPSAVITREEAMVMIGRAMKTAGLNAESADADAVLAAFADGANVSGWAKEPAAAAIAQGLVNGADGRLRPGEAISRAETAAIVYRLLHAAGWIGG